MNRVEKSQLADELKECFSKAQVAIFADYRGLSASKADELRRFLREQNAEVKVLKNNVARLIVKDGSMGSDAKALMDRMVGPTLVAFAYREPASVAKAMHKFAQDNEFLKIKESLIGQQQITASAVEELAKLPSKNVLVAQLLGVLNAPVSRFVSVLAAVPRSLVTVLSALDKKKESA